MYDLNVEFQRILNEINNVNFEFNNYQNFMKALHQSNKIFTTGKGRSGLVVQMFSNRLVQLGKQVHVVGEVTCPAVTRDDLYLIVTGSGSDVGVLENVKVVKKIGGKVAIITTNTQSPITQISDYSIIINTDTKYSEEKLSKQPMGALFEQTALLILESLVMEIKSDLCLSEKDMELRHANIE